MLSQLLFYFFLLILPFVFLLVLLAKNNNSNVSKNPASSSSSSISAPQLVLPLKSYPLVGHFLAMSPQKHRRVQFSAEMLQNSSYATFVFHHLFGRRHILTASPDVVKHILKTNFHNYQKGDAVRIPRRWHL